MTNGERFAVVVFVVIALMIVGSAAAWLLAFLWEEMP
jgi:hypothetical protein